MKIYVLFPFLTLFFLLICTSCNNSTMTRRIDNPTNVDITVSLDGETKIIPANSSIEYVFDYGKHTLIYDSCTVNFIAKPSYFDVVINPTRSNYILYTDVYFDRNDSKYITDREELTMNGILSQVEVIIDDSLHEVSLPFKILNGLFIESVNNYWNYNLDEKLPEVIKEKGSATVKSKLFREADFIEFLKTNNPDIHISFVKTTKTLDDLPKFELPIIDLHQISCSNGKQAIEGVLDHYDKWLNMRGGEFSKEFSNYFLKIEDVALTENQKRECLTSESEDISYAKASAAIKNELITLNRVNFFIVP